MRFDYRFSSPSGIENTCGVIRADGPGERHGTALTWHAVNLDLATTRAQYITGEQALNLNDRQSGPHGGTADWRAWWLSLRLAATHENYISV